MRPIATRLLIQIFVIALLAGCTSLTERTADPRVDRAVDTAVGMLGVPYRYGGTTAKGMDCSGLVYLSYRSVGISVPRTSQAQFNAVTRIDDDDLRRGDLLFFGSGGRVSHVAIYVGDDQFIHAPGRGKQVSFGQLADGWYAQHYMGAGRVD